MATQQSMDTVQKAYIGYYGRPADPAGLTYWADRLDENGGDLSALINEFGNSDEYQDRFAGMDNETLVNNLYQQLFNRDAEQEGLDFYVAKLENEDSTLSEIALDIMNGAQNSDAVALENKLVVANDFTAQIDELELVYGEGQIDAAVDLVESVDSSTDLASVDVGDVLINFPAQPTPNSLFTLKEQTETTVTTTETTTTEIYWGYNPHGHGETDVDNMDGNDPSGNDSNLTNEGIADGGVKLADLLTTLSDTGLFNLAEIFPELFGQIDVANPTEFPFDAVSALTINGGSADGAGGTTVEIGLESGEVAQAEVELAQSVLDYMDNLLFDEEGNSRLFEVTTTTPANTSVTTTVPVVLTPTENSGNTEEEGYTGEGDNLIVAGRTELLHKAYIDGGEGTNTLEVSMKGVLAQPKEVVNVQHVTVQNLPNVYTTEDADGNAVNNYNPDNADLDTSANSVNYLDSILDLTHAREVETVTITEGGYDGLNASNATDVANAQAAADAATALAADAQTAYDTATAAQDVAQVNAAEAEVARDALEVTRDAEQVDVNTAQTAVDNAQTALDTALAANPQVPATIAAAQTTLDTAQGVLDTEQAVLDAAQAELDTAQTALDSANATLATADATEISANTALVNANAAQVAAVDAAAAAVDPSASDADSMGGLVVTGLRDNPTVILEGAFTQNVTTHFSGSLEDGVNLVLNLGKVDSILDILDDSETVNIESTGGGNVLSESNLGDASLITMNISGDAKLKIDGSLVDQFAANTPATIDASANTAGVDLELTGFSDEIVFIGTAASDDHFEAGSGRSVAITGGEGNNEFVATADEDITITSGNGNNQIDADNSAAVTDLDNEDIVTVTVGGGNNDITVASADNFVIAAGDGANRIEAVSADTGSSVTDIDASTIVVGEGHNEIDAVAPVLEVTAGNGGNEIEATAGKATITTGTGNDVISATGTGSADTATINAGEGNNTVTVSGFETVAVTSGAGDDALTIIGGNQQLDSADNGAGQLVGENGNETLITVNLGSGTNTLTLGSDVAATNAAGDLAITAMPGSTITGENITLVLQSDADVSRADITGVTAVQLGNADELTLSLSQFKAMGGSTAFSVIGEEFGASSVLTIVVDENTSLDDLNIEALPRSIDLSFEVMDTITLEMTAQQLHERVTDGGVTAYADNNGDFAEGTVLITGAGEDFDAYDAALTGSIDEGAASLNLRLDATPDGYERPADVTSYTRLQINTDELTNGEQTPFDTAHTFLRITGDSDFIFTPVEAGIDEWGQDIANAGDSIQLGNGTDNFKVDFSSVNGTVTGLTLDNFENVDAIYGNGNARVDVKLEGDVAADDQGLISKGISEFVVVDVTEGDQVNLTYTYAVAALAPVVDDTITVTINDQAFEVVSTGAGLDIDMAALTALIDADPMLSATYTAGTDTLVVTSATPLVESFVLDIDLAGTTTVTATQDTVTSASTVHTFYTCETTQDLDVLGIQGLAGETVRFENTERGVEYLMEVEYAKDSGYAVGSLFGEFERADGAAVVNVVALDSGAETQKVEGIELVNAISAEINVTGGDTEIESFVSHDVESVVLTADAALTIDTVLDGTIESVDATGVVGDLALSIAPTADFAFEGNAGSTTLTLTSALDTDASVSFASAGELTLLIDGNDAADAGNTAVTTNLTSADLSGVDAIVIGDDDTVTMTIAQTEAMGKANITGDGTLALTGLGEEEFSLAGYHEELIVTGVNLTIADADGDGVVTLHADTDLTNVTSLVVPKGVTLNLTAAQYQQLNGNGTITGEANGAGVTVDFAVNITDLMQSDVDNGFNIDGITAKDVSVTLAESVEIPAHNVGAGISTDLFPTFAAGTDQSGANGVDESALTTLSVTWNIGDDMTLSAPEVPEFDGVSVVGGANSTLEFTDTDNDAANTLDTIDASGFDVDQLKVDEGYVSGQNIDNLFQGLVARVVKQIFDLNGDVVAQDQTVNIEAGVTIGGSLEINRVEDEFEIADLTLNLNGGVIINGELTLDSTDKNDGANDLLHAHMQSLTINSTGTEGNEFSGSTANIIVGAIDGSGSSNETQNNVLDITINAEQVLDLQGGIVFSSATGDDAFTLGDDTEAAATVTVNGTADVNLGSVNTTDDDVDSLTVHNAGTGAVSVTVDVANVDQDVAGENVDSLAFTGSNINLAVIADGVGEDLDLSDDDLSGVATLSVEEASTVSLSLTQFNTLTAANIVVVDGTDAGDTVAATAGLDIVDYDGSAFDATTLDENFSTVTLSLVDGDVTLDPSVDLTDVSEIFVQEGRVLNLTAAQYQQLKGTGTITAVDTDGDTVIAGITVNITDLTQADIWVDDGDGEQEAGEGFDLSAITTGVSGSIVVTQSATEDTITLGSFDDEGLASQALDVDVSSNLNSAEYVLGDNQTLELVNSSQADGLDVTGGADSTVVFRFDTLDAGQINATIPGIDVSGYDITELHTLNTLYQNAGTDGEQNVEVILENLASAVELIITSDPLALGLVSARMRMVTIEEGVNVNGELVFNDIQQTVELTTLTIDFEGDASITGNLRIPTIDQGNTLQAANFGTLTINSNGTESNSITGDITAEVGVANAPTTTTETENSLLNVVINATSDLEIGIYADADGEHTSGGDIHFTALEDGAVANLTIEGTANVKMHGIDATDADDNGSGVTPDIATVNIVNNAGTLTMTGGTAAIAGDGIETLNISGTGDVVLGNNDSLDGAPSASEGVESDTVSTIDASGLTGNLDLGELSDIDSTDFTFTAGTGVTTVELDDTAFGSINNDAANAWTFDLSNAAAGSELTIGGSIVFADASGDPETTNALSIDVGTNQVVIAADQDFTNLDSLTVNGTIVLQAGIDLVLTAEQASGLTIIADPSIITDPATVGYDNTTLPTVTIMELGTAEYDFSNILAGVHADGALDDNGDKLVVVDSLAAVDVEVHANTDLGEAQINLDDVADVVDNINDALQGQTIRFNTEEQAARRIDAEAATGTESVNVIWLFDEITASIDTSGYSSEIDRLWFSQALATNEGGDIEQLYTSLASSILRIDFVDLDDLAEQLVSVGFNRTIELVHFSDTSASGLQFSDAVNIQNLMNLTVDMGGEVNTGDITLNNLAVPGAGETVVVPNQFSTLTINSELADETGDLLAAQGFVNDDDGNPEAGENVQPDADTGNTVGDISTGGSDDVDLMNVVLNTNGSALTVGTITFSTNENGDTLANEADDAAVIESEETATLTIANADTVEIASLDTSDTDVEQLNIVKSGAGDLNIVGASPAGAVDGTEVVTITQSGEGDITFGTDGDDDKPGFSGDSLSTVTVTGNGNGAVDLGVISTVDSDDFTLTTDGKTGTGNVSAILEGTLDGSAYEAALTTYTDALATYQADTGVAASQLALVNAYNALAAASNASGVFPELDDTQTTSVLAAQIEADEVDVAGGVAGANDGEITTALADYSTWTITMDAGDSVTFNENTTITGGRLTVAGAGDLIVDGDFDWSVLAELNVGAVEVSAGNTLTLTAAQANGMTVTGAGNVVITDVEDLQSVADELNADLDGIDVSGTVTVNIDTSDVDGEDPENALPQDFTVNAVFSLPDTAVVDIIGGGSVDFTGSALVPAGLTYTVATETDITLTAAQADEAIATGTGTATTTVNVTADTDADFTGLATAGGVDAIVDTGADGTVVFTGDFGTADIFINQGETLVSDFATVDGLNVNEEAGLDPAGSGTGALSVTLQATDLTADFTGITGDLPDANRTAVVQESMIFTGDFDGVIVDVDADDADEIVTLTTSADRIDGLTVRASGATAGLQEQNLVVTDLATNLAVDLSGVDTTELDAATAAFDADGTFTGDLGTVVVTVADGVTMTAAANILDGDADVNRAADTGTGGVAVTVGAADAGVDLNEIGGTGTAAIIESITVTEDVTFTGTLHTTNPTDVANGVTLTTIAAKVHNLVVNQSGTTGAVVITDDASGTTLSGTADFTVDDLTDGLTATAVTGDLDVTISDDGDGSTVALGGGTNTIDADAMVDDNVLTLTDTGTDTSVQSTQTVTFGDGYNAVGDIINVIVDGVVYQHVVTAGTVGSGINIAAAFNTLINGNDANVTSATGGTAVLTLTAVTAGVPFIVTTEDDNAAGTATATVAGGVANAIAAGDVTVTLTDGDLDASGADATDVTVTASGDGIANDITTGDGDDNISTESGDDTIVAGDGDDVINGGTGADNMTGGDGNDTFVFDSTDDVVATEIIAGGTGLDSIEVDTTEAIDFSLATVSGIVELDLNAGGDNTTVTYDAADFALLANVVADTNDTITVNGLVSTESYSADQGGSGADTVFEFANADSDVTITDFSAADDVLDVRDLVNSAVALTHQNSAGTAVAAGANGDVQITDENIIYISVADISTVDETTIEGLIASNTGGVDFGFQVNGDEAVFVVGEGAGTDGVLIFHGTDADVTDDNETITLVGTITGLNLTDMTTTTLD